MNDSNPFEDLRKGLRNLAITTIVLFLLLALSFGYFWWKAHEAHDALCKFQRNLGAQIDDQNQFLYDLDHNRRDAIPGITRQDIVLTLTRQKITFDSLRGLGCHVELKDPGVK